MKDVWLMWWFVTPLEWFIFAEIWGQIPRACLEVGKSIKASIWKCQVLVIFIILTKKRHNKSGTFHLQQLVIGCLTSPVLLVHIYCSLLANIPILRLIFHCCGWNVFSSWHLRPRMPKRSHTQPLQMKDPVKLSSLLSNLFLLNQPHFFVVPVLHRFAMIKSPFFMLINPSFWWIHRNHWCFITIKLVLHLLKVGGMKPIVKIDSY